MITYSFENVSRGHFTEHLYECIKSDIREGRLSPKEKLPSKRTLAAQLGLSVITVENAYNLLLSEGYIFSVPQKGFYVEEITGNLNPLKFSPSKETVSIPYRKKYRYDLSAGKMNPDNFPFSIWKKLMRKSFSDMGETLINTSTSSGLSVLREAISGHLGSFRGMKVDPNCIFIGAGTEYLYGLLIQLLGRDKKYCLENPGYRKIYRIYESNNVSFCFAGLDSKGIITSEIVDSGADIIHISPTHHYPTGITMPVSRRMELLKWASEMPGRYIIEDDYDSEFRLNGKPVPTMQSIDDNGRVIYMNTFSKSLASTIRISYMVLPPALAKKYYDELSFYSCTVSNFEQYTLAKFISEGFFEKHINRMRLFYAHNRKDIISAIKTDRISEYCDVLERDSGLHFILRIKCPVNSKIFHEKLEENDINLLPLSSFYMTRECHEDNLYIVNYSNLDLENFRESLAILYRIISEVKL